MRGIISDAGLTIEEFKKLLSTKEYRGKPELIETIGRLNS